MFFLFKSIISFIVKYIRHQFIVRHVYLYGYNWYNTLLFNIHIINMDSILEKLIHRIFHILKLRKYPNNPLAYASFYDYKRRILSYEYNTPLEEFLIYKGLRYVSPFYNTIHRKLLTIVIIYDILFNDMILIHMYQLLPYVFIYELWIKFKTFVGERIYGIGDPDLIIHGILYKPGYKAMEGLFVIDGQYYDSSLIGEIVVYYVYNDFRDIHHKWTYDYSSKKENVILRQLINSYSKIQKELTWHTICKFKRLWICT